jgi:hypothetical protein
MWLMIFLCAFPVAIILASAVALYIFQHPAAPKKVAPAVAEKTAEISPILLPMETGTADIFPQCLGNVMKADPPVETAIFYTPAYKPAEGEKVYYVSNTGHVLVARVIRDDGIGFTLSRKGHFFRKMACDIRQREQFFAAQAVS